MFRLIRHALLILPLSGFLLAPCANAELDAAVRSSRQQQTVVLLHGMGRGRASLWVLEMRLKQAGFRTLNFPYLANAQTIDQISRQLDLFIKTKVKTQTYHLVAHSLGNIIIRNGFKTGYPPGLGRVVMLAPPNQPAELARALKDNPVYKWFTGESGQMLASDEFYATLPKPTVEFGVIAGDRGHSLVMDTPNDGVITVDSTKLDGMKDWTLVHHAHTFLMNSRQVGLLCVRFIEHGDFALEPDEIVSETADLLYDGKNLGPGGIYDTDD